MKKQSKAESDPMSSAWKIYVQRYGPKFNSYYSNYQVCGCAISSADTGWIISIVIIENKKGEKRSKKPVQSDIFGIEQKIEDLANKSRLRKVMSKIWFLIAAIEAQMKKI